MTPFRRKYQMTPFRRVLSSRQDGRCDVSTPALKGGVTSDDAFQAKMPNDAFQAKMPNDAFQASYYALLVKTARLRFSILISHVKMNLFADGSTIITLYLFLEEMCFY